jgi:HSP20 family protein
MSRLPTPSRGHGGSPSHPLVQFRRDFNALFDRFFGGSWPVPFGQEDFLGPMRTWDFGVTEGDKELIVRAELPGFDENDLDVQLQDNILTIRAEKQQKGDGSQDFCSFYRRVTLPPGVDPDQV